MIFRSVQNRFEETPFYSELYAMQWSIIHLQSKNWKSIDKKVNLASKTQFQGGFHLLICKNQRSIITCWRSILTSALSSKFFFENPKNLIHGEPYFFPLSLILKKFQTKLRKFWKGILTKLTRNRI